MLGTSNAPRTPLHRQVHALTSPTESIFAMEKIQEIVREKLALRFLLGVLGRCATSAQRGRHKEGADLLIRFNLDDPRFLYSLALFLARKEAILIHENWDKNEEGKESERRSLERDVEIVLSSMECMFKVRLQFFERLFI